MAAKPEPVPVMTSGPKTPLANAPIINSLDSVPQMLRNVGNSAYREFPMNKK